MTNRLQLLSAVRDFSDAKSETGGILRTHWQRCLLERWWCFGRKERALILW